jgi:MYXO-CTERM domain-containing protein
MRRAIGQCVAAAVLAVTVRGTEAQACGGCFAPPGAVQVVTDHRMVLSLSPSQTTLWDQFRYSGDPTEFSWILPIHYSDAVQVRIGDNRFMNLVDNLTAPTLYAPARPYQNCGGYPGVQDAAVAADAGAAADTGVTVYRQEVVGPYAVAIVGGSDPMAIRDWLASNGYSTPPAVSPVIDYYTGLHSDFVALRLRPGEGISQMTPVRVSLPGYQPTLPLRMIAAGVADRVGLTLLVLASGRTEAMNFPNGEVVNDDLTYDFDAPTSPVNDYLAAFDRVNAAQGGRAWITESAVDVTDSMIENLAQNSVYVMPLQSLCGADGGVPDAGCTDPDPVDDAQVAFRGLGSTAMITRLRADLPATMLDRDLLLQASTLGAKARDYQYGHVLHTPAVEPCPDGGTGFDGSVSDARRPADDAGGAGGGVKAVGGCVCSAVPGATSGGGLAAAALGLAVALTATRRRRR